MPRLKKTSPAGGYHKVISTGNGEFANYNKIVQAFGSTGGGRGLLRHSINEPQGPREYERIENIPERPPPKPRSDPLLTELSNLNADSGSSLHDFDSDDKSDISHVDKQNNTRSWINSAASYIPRYNNHGTSFRNRYGLDNTQYQTQSQDMMSRLEYQLHLKERQLAFTTSIVEQQNRFLYEQLDGFLTMPPMRRFYDNDMDRPIRHKNLPKPGTNKRKQKKTKIDSTEKVNRLLESMTNNGSGDMELKTCTETIAQDRNIKPRNKNQYEEIKFDVIAEEVCQQGCPTCYIEKFVNLEEYSNHIKQKSHIKVKKLARKRSDTIIKDLICNNSRPNTENGLEFIQTVKGYYCQLCQLIFCEEMEAKVNHCETDTHIILFKNLIDNSDAIEKALADAMIKTQNKNLNETENVTRPCSSSLIDTNLSQDIRDLCIDKLEEVLAEKEQISLSKSKECNSVMFTECSDLEKGFFTEQELRRDISFEVCPSVKDSRTLVKKANISLDTMAEIEDVPTYFSLSTSAKVKSTESVKNSSISNKMDISLPYTLSNTANSQNDIKLRYYGLFPDKKEVTNDSSSNSDEEEALTNIKAKVAIKDLTTVSQNSTWSLQQCVTSSVLSNHMGVLHQSTNEEKQMKINDMKCTQSKTSIEKVSKSNMDEINEAEASNSSKDESQISDDYDTDSDNVVSSDTDISNRSTNKMIRESITNSCLSEDEVSKADDLNGLDTTIKEDLLCYKCLQEFEKTLDLNPANSTAVKTDGNKAESCSENHVLGHHGKECTNQILVEDKELSNISKSGCLMENYYICQDGLGHKNTLGNDSYEKSTQICDMSLYSDCDEPDDQQITEEHVKTIKSAANDSDIKFYECTKYSISVQKDLDPFNSDLDLLPSTSFNYSTALDFDINGNTLGEHNDFEVDGFDVHEEIFCRNIMTQTYSMVTPHNSRYMGDEDYLVSEKIEVQNSEREPPDGIEDKKHTLLQVYNTSENNCLVPSILSQDIKREEDLNRNTLSNSTTLVDCEALIHFIDSVIGEQQKTTEMMMMDSYNQPLDNSAEEDCDKLDLASRANENLNVISTYSHDDIESDQVSVGIPDHQCDISNENMLPAFSETKDDSGITDDYDEGFVCPRNSPQLWLISKGNHFSSNNLDKDKTINASLDKCDIAEWLSSQKSPSHDVGFSSVGTKIDTMDNVCFDDQNTKEIKADRTFFQTQAADAHCDIEGCGEDLTVVENKDPFVEETDIIIQVRTCNITVNTSETLSIDICEDTTIETTFQENQEF